MQSQQQSEGSAEVRTLLSRHKDSLLRELEATNLLGALHKRGVISEAERENLRPRPGGAGPDVELFIELVQAKGFDAFREFCFALEAECPHVLTDLLVDQHALTEEHEQQQLKLKQHQTVDEEQPQQQQQNSCFMATASSPAAFAASVNSNNNRNDDVQQQQQQQQQQGQGYPGYEGSPREESPPPPPPPPLPTSTANSSSSNSNTNVNGQGQAHYGHHLQQASYGECNGVGKDAPGLEVLDEPVDEQVGGSDRGWEVHHVTVTRVPGYGFGIAVSGGRDNPHFTNGDPAIAISDVLKAGPAEGKLQVNDRIISANGVSLEGADYGAAVRVLRDSGSTVLLVVKRRAGVRPCSPTCASTGQPQSQHQHQQSSSTSAMLNSSGSGGIHHQSQPSQSLMQLGDATCSSLMNGSLIHSGPSNNQNQGQPQQHRLSLTRTSKKDDFGLVLGCRLYIRDVTREGTGARVGDLIERISGLPADNMSLKEARKLMDQSKERLSLVVSRTEPQMDSSLLDKSSGLLSHQSQLNSSSDYLLGGTGSGGLNSSVAQAAAAAAAAYSSQNLYVPPPTRQTSTGASVSSPSSNGMGAVGGGASGVLTNANGIGNGQQEDKSNLAPRGGRSRGPLVEPLALAQLDLPATPTQGMLQGNEPPRPPPPRPEDYYSSRRQLYDDDPLIQRVKQPVPDPRFITFQKEGSVGVRLTGGNETGVFVTAVQPGSPASLQGLQPGDKILKVNDMDMKGVTREEAVLFLLSLQEQIDLIVQHRRQEYEQIIASGKGDSFHIKTHFHYENPEKGEMSFRSGDVFHVVDTLHNGVVGAWQVFRIGRNNQEVQKGIIPNKARAEELATAQFNATKKELSANESRGSFFRRRRGSHRRSKSLGRDHWDDVVFSDSVSKFPAYERVVLRHPGFVRPIVLFGPVADLAREKLFKDFPDKFTAPQSECQIEEGSSSKSTKTSGIIRLSAIRDVMERGKHALLDITPNAVDRLNYAQFYPIVIFFKAETKQTVKEMRAGIPKSAHKSSKKLLEQCQKLDKIWGHVFSATITLTSPESWYRKLRELIDWQQQGPLWMSQTKPEEALSDDFLFPMTSRLSYASSPESDLELSPAPSLPGTLTAPSRLKSSSDPSIATQDDAVAPPPYTTAGYQQLVQSLNSTSIGGNGPSANATLSNGTSTDVLSQQQQQQSSTSQLQMQQAHQFSPSAADISGAYAEQQRRRSQQQGPPDLPPRLDRNSKPPHHGGSATSPVRSAGVGAPGSAGGSAAGVYSQHGTMRSAQERLISKADSCLDMGNYINATPHRATAATASTTTLERTQAKAGSYDSMSSYDSYNTNGNVAYPGSGRLGPNVPDDLKTSTLGVSSRPHDPYRFTRSTAIPVQESQPRTDYAKYSRAGEYKPAPPPHGKSTGTYKPIPPPKPKNYRPPQQTMVQDENNGGSLYQHAKSYSMGNSHMYNGAGNGMDMQRNSNQYYYNITPNRGAQNDGYSVNSNHNHSHTSPSSHNHSMSHSHHLSSPSMMSHSHSNSSGQIGVAHSSHNRNVAMNGHSHSNSHSGVSLQSSNAVNNSHNRESSALDLAGSREQRGSAFELYRKPLHHHNMRPMGMARGTFGNEGGVLEGPGGVSLIIPPGALPPNSHQEIHFSVTDPNGVELYSNIRGHRSSLSPPMHNGESMLSPLVECGPKGLEFLCPIELRIPHSATPAHRLALKATDTEGNHNANWLNVKLPDPTSDHVIVRLDHF